MTTQEAYEKMRAWLTREGAERCSVPRDDLLELQVVTS